ncbi:MAG: hypothetical protein DI568_06560 [Sphingomonas sp.]|nr:MAG: hypothetical protein DI568_06560 [Sphingomonas sp.]
MDDCIEYFRPIRDTIVSRQAFNQRLGSDCCEQSGLRVVLEKRSDQTRVSLKEAVNRRRSFFYNGTSAPSQQLRSRSKSKHSYVIGSHFLCCQTILTVL